MTTFTTPRLHVLTPGMPPRFERFRFMSADAGAAGTVGVGTGDAAGQAGAATGGEQQDPGDQGFPANTPVKDMTVDQQVAYWKVQARRHESRAAAHADYDTIKTELEQLRARTQTAEEKAIEDAKAAGRAEATTATLPRLLQAEFRAAAAGRVTPEQLASVTAPLDPKFFLTAKGDEVDTAKVQTFIDGIAPAAPGKTWPAMGQGRHETVPTNAREAGRAAAERRFGKKQTATT